MIDNVSTVLRACSDFSTHTHTVPSLSGAAPNCALTPHSLSYSLSLSLFLCNSLFLFLRISGFHFSPFFGSLHLLLHGVVCFGLWSLRFLWFFGDFSFPFFFSFWVMLGFWEMDSSWKMKCDSPFQPSTSATVTTRACSSFGFLLSFNFFFFLVPFCYVFWLCVLVTTV